MVRFGSFPTVAQAESVSAALKQYGITATVRAEADGGEVWGDAADQLRAEAFFANGLEFDWPCSCGALNAPGLRACDRCGAVRQIPHWRCPSCSTVVPDDLGTCWNCGVTPDSPPPVEEVAVRFSNEKPSDQARVDTNTLGPELLWAVGPLLIVMLLRACAS